MDLKDIGYDMWTGFMSLRGWGLVVGFVEYCDEFSGTVISEEFLDQLNDY
jgi:hypothetical protein